jgi:hypothetical protein
MDIGTLHAAHVAFLDAARRVADAGGSTLVPRAGEWNSDQIVAHVALVDAATLATAASLASGANTTFDNRIPLDAWTIEQVTALAGGVNGLQLRVRALGETLCALTNVLSDAELDTLVPSLLLSSDKLIVNQPMTMRALITGLGESELPAHEQQLLSLLP